MYFISKTILTITTLGILAACTNNKSAMNYNEIKNQSTQELRNVLQVQSGWVKVHAAEFLLWAGYPDGVREIYEAEEKSFGNESQYRIGIWRVLAQAAVSQEQKAYYIDKVIQAFLDTNGTDRIHAAETLAKLEKSPVGVDGEVSREALQSPVKPLAWYTQWSVAFSSPDSLVSSRSAFLTLIQGDDPTGRTIGAYALRKLGRLSEEEWAILAKTALNESPSSPAAVYLLSAAFVTKPDDRSPKTTVSSVYQALTKYANSPVKGNRMEMAMALSEEGSEKDIPLLLSLFQNENPLGIEADDADVRAAAAYALLKIIERIG